jgi:hypothetical protein
LTFTYNASKDVPPSASAASITSRTPVSSRSMAGRVSVSVGEPGSLPRQEVGKAKRIFERTGEHDPLEP